MHPAEASHDSVHAATPLQAMVQPCPHSLRAQADAPAAQVKLQLVPLQVAVSVAPDSAVKLHAPPGHWKAQVPPVHVMLQPDAPGQARVQPLHEQLFPSGQTGSPHAAPSTASSTARSHAVRMPSSAQASYLRKAVLVWPGCRVGRSNPGPVRCSLRTKHLPAFPGGHMSHPFPVALLSAVLAAAPALAQYSKSAGHNAPAAEQVRREYLDDTGKKQVRVEEVPVARDDHGNAQGNQHDLAVDGAFTGQTIFVLQYHTFDFELPKAALVQKGFNVVRVYQQTPTPKELETMLSKSNQFWLISNCYDKVELTAAHHAVIKKFFDAGHGVYLWGDNDPCNADADALASKLIDARVKGDTYGDKTVGISKKDGQPGLAQDHLITTGLEYVYEGITVATVKPAGKMTPVIWGSAGNLVAAAFEHGGKRLIVDGGFTRLYGKWDTAGTGRYVKNAAAWLANVERFGDAVVADKFRKQ